VLRDASLAQEHNDQHIRAACVFVLGDLPRPLELVSAK